MSKPKPVKSVPGTAYLTYHHEDSDRDPGPTIDVPCRVTPSRVIIDHDVDCGDYWLRGKGTHIQYDRHSGRATGVRSTNWALDRVETDKPIEIDTTTEPEEGDE